MYIDQVFHIVINFILTHTSFQTLLSSVFPDSGYNLECEVSVDSIMDYGQYAILSNGNFLYSGATAESTMDFSKKPIDHDVVDSPPNGGTRRVIVSSPSPLRSRSFAMPLRCHSTGDCGTQRKLYEGEQSLIGTQTV